MLRAEIAGRTIELIGCDAMPHADKFACFAQEFSDADCTIQVSFHDVLTKPIGDDFGRVGEWIRIRLDDGRLAFGHKSAAILILTDEGFSRVHVQFRRDIPKLETLHYLYVMRIFSYHMQLHGGCLIHGSGVKFNDCGLALCGRSGVGKTTMTRLLMQAESSLTVLSDDGPAVCTKQEKRPMLYGTPFCGGDTLCCRDGAPLNQLVFLKQASMDRIVIPSEEEAAYLLLSVMQRTALHEPIMRAMTDRVSLLVKQVPIVCFENRGISSSAEQLLEYCRGI